MKVWAWLLSGALLICATAQSAESLEADLEAFDREVMRAVRENDLKNARQMFVGELKDDPQFRKHLPSMWESLQKAALRFDFEAPDIVLSAGKIKRGQEIACGEGERFLARFEAPGDRGAVVLRASVESFQRYLLILIYLNREGRWRLQFAHVGLWKVGGMDADSWFGKAQQLASLKHMVPALLHAQVGGSIFRPAPLLRFKQEQAMRSLAEKIERDAAQTLSLPLNLLEAPGYPQVIRVEPEFDGGRLVPVVHYISRIAIKTEKAHRESAQQVVEQLEKALPGLRGDFPRVVLRVYNEPPTDPQRNYAYLNIPVDAAGN